VSCPRLVIFFKDFSPWVGYSSVGLNVVARTTAEELVRHGVPASVFGVRNNVDLFHVLDDAEKVGTPFTHVVVMAPWLSPLDLKSLLIRFGQIQFAVQTHTNIGALHGDYNGVANIRQYLDLMFSFMNLSVAANTLRLAIWESVVYGQNILVLPNLYPVVKRPRRCHTHSHYDAIRIGSFGAIRMEKNFITATAAALAIQKLTNRRVEFNMSVGCENAPNVLRTIRQLTDGVPGFTLIQHRWQPWDKFKRLVARMDLLLQPSHTESFNMVTADGIAEGVPSVVSPAITWVPESWKADPDDAMQIAAIGIHLLNNEKRAVIDGFDALRRHNADALYRWLDWLGVPVPARHHWYTRWCTLFD
jgi:hypothetical protein